MDQLLAAHPRLVDAEGNAIPLPNEVYAVLRDVVEAMQGGRAIVLTPTAMRLTTGEAAEILGVSRPTLVKLLEEGKIPYEKPNRHRYVRLEDLEAYGCQVTEKRRRAIRELTRTGVESPVVPDPDEVAQALKAARREISQR